MNVRKASDFLWENWDILKELDGGPEFLEFLDFVLESHTYKSGHNAPISIKHGRFNKGNINKLFNRITDWEEDEDDIPF